MLDALEVPEASTFASDLISPSLTTVAAPLNQLAQRATSLLVTMIQRNTNPPAEPQTLPIQLIVRESTGEPGTAPRQHCPWWCSQD